MGERELLEKDHKEWLARNRHLLDAGHLLALGEKLTPEEQKKLDDWYAVKRG